MHILKSLKKRQEVIVQWLINGGYLNFIDPTLDSRKACPFWRAGLCPFVLHAEIYTGDHVDEAYILDLKQIKCDVQILKQSSTVTHYLFKKQQNMLQIKYVGVRPIDQVLKFIIRAGGMVGQGERSLSFKRLHYLIRNLDLSKGLFKVNKSSRNFYKILRVIDLLKDEYHHRDVAEILFPLAQVQRDWGKDPSRILEKKTSAKIKRVKELIAKNYKNYIRKLDS